MLTNDYLAAYCRYKLETSDLEGANEQFMKVRILFNELLESSLSRMESAGRANPQEKLEETVVSLYNQAQWRIKSRTDSERHIC